MEQFKVVACGEFNCNELNNHIQEAAVKFVEENAKTIYVYVDVYDQDGNTTETLELNLCNLLLDYIDYSFDSEQADCIAGGYIESSLRKFDEESFWQFGLSGDNGIISPASRIKTH